MGDSKTRGFRIGFEFIPMPLESITVDPPLILAELKLLLYLLKQVRFGEAPEPISDDELLNGTFNSQGDREDTGCGLSRNSLRTGRDALIERGWLEVESVSNDRTRPRFIHRLVLANSRQRVAVKKSELVSNFDTVKKSEQVSEIDSAVSNSDTAVSKLDSAVSNFDRCNKEEESTNRKTSIEKAGDRERRLSPAERDTWDLRRYREARKDIAPPAGDPYCYLDGEEKQQADLELDRRAAFISGITIDRLVELLRPFFPNDPYIEKLKISAPLFEKSA